MMQHSFQPRDQIFVKAYGFLSFAKNINKNLSGKYSQNLLDHAKESATDTVKTIIKRVIQETAETAGYLISNKIADKIMKASKT